MEKQLQAFTFGQIQDALTLLETIGNAGYTVDDLRTYVQNASEKFNKEVRYYRPNNRRAPLCPECKTHRLRLQPVNTQNPRAKIKEPDARWFSFCPDEMNCGFIGPFNQWPTEVN